MARVQVSDEIWAAFRTGLGATPVSVGLGELVRRAVGRSLRRSASDLEGVRIALEDARQLSDELASLIARLERAGSAPIRSADLDSPPQRERPHGQITCTEGWPTDP
jgi:hypothetical protein